MEGVKNGNQYPEHWQLKKLGEMCKPKEGLRRGPFGSAIKKEFFVPDGFKVYEQANAIYDDAFRGKYYINESKYHELINFKIIAGDLIVSCSGTLGRIAEIPPTAKPGIINQALLRIRLIDNMISKKYFLYYFRSAEFQRKIFDQSQGTAMSNLIGIKDFKEIEIPLPPLSEQTAIVSKIEELLSDLENGKQQLLTAQQQLSTYRQSLLKWAFEGRLTNPPDGRAGKNVNGELPKGWKWVRLGDVLDFVGSGVTPKGGQSVYKTQGVIFLRSQNVYPNKLELDDVAYITDEIDERMQRTRVKPHDVLLNITGASIGRCAFVPAKFPRGNVNQHVCILRASQEKLLSKYLSSYLNSPNAQHGIMNEQAGATRQGLNFQQIRNFEIPFCTVKEQEQIVSELESKLTVCDKIEETITTSLQQAEMLKQSILKKAFEGKLVNHHETKI